MTDFDRMVEERFEALRGDGLRALREAAFARYCELGLPTTQHEEWKYTSLVPLLEARLSPAARARVEVSGGGAYVKSLRDFPELIRQDGPGDALAALNAALLDEGIVIHLPAGTKVPEPIQLRFFTEGGLSSPRVAIVAGPHSEATIVEAHQGPAGAIYLKNAVTEISLGEGAQIAHYKLQEESERAFHLALVQVHHGQGSRFSSHSLALGGALARNEVRALFAAEGSECTLNGLYMAGGKQHLDNRTLVDHQSPRCTSRELYKGVLDGQSRGVFSGKVLVQKDAQKTDASQINKNLLLSEGALVDTKPQLEIFNDDVKCAHGAAVGQLDEDALFYLRSRGLSREAARSMLTWAFASEMVNLIPLAPLRARVRELVTSRLAESLMGRAA